MFTSTLSGLAFSTLLLAGCSQPANTAVDYDAPTLTEWARLKQLHIVFGHQSVGANLIAGVRALAQAQQIDLPIADSVETDRDVVIRQFPIGVNGNPAGKLDAFSQALQQGAGAYADVAEMKFCFVDFDSTTDSQKLADTYIQQTETLSAQYPHIAFIATTSPLTTIQTGPKAWLKRMLGGQPAGYAENLRRYQFNQILRAHYGNSPALFDLAAFESLHARSTFVIDNKTVEALAPALSSDGGHLNDSGQRLIAAAWIHHLASLPLRHHENAAPAINQ